MNMKRTHCEKDGFFSAQLTGDRIIASAHIRCLNLSEYMKIAENVKEFFHNEGIHSTTIQPEFVDFHQQPADGNGNEDCVLSCSKVVERLFPSYETFQSCVACKLSCCVSSLLSLCSSFFCSLDFQNVVRDCIAI